jgi:hypothetical protein
MAKFISFWTTLTELPSTRVYIDQEFGCEELARRRRRFIEMKIMEVMKKMNVNGKPHCDLNPENILL